VIFSNSWLKKSIFGDLLKEALQITKILSGLSSISRWKLPGTERINVQCFGKQMEEHKFCNYEVLPKSSGNLNSTREPVVVWPAPLDGASSTLCELVCNSSEGERPRS
jgi:hypothetical protein